MLRVDRADALELRVRRGLLAVVRGGTAIEFKLGRKLYVVDWPATVAGGSAIIVESELPAPDAAGASVGGE